MSSLMLAAAKIDVNTKKIAEIWTLKRSSGTNPKWFEGFRHTIRPHCSEFEPTAMPVEAYSALRKSMLLCKKCKYIVS